MAVEPIIPAGASPPIAPYSPGARAQHFAHVVHTAGVLPLDAEGRLRGGDDAGQQTRAVLENIETILEAAGGGLEDIAFNLIFLSDLADYAKMNEVYREFFGAKPPARACVRADLVKPEFLVEIASTAYLTN